MEQKLLVIKNVNKYGKRSASRLLFCDWVTHNARVSERMITYLPEEFISGLAPIILLYHHQLDIARYLATGVDKYDIRLVTFHVLPDHVQILVAVRKSENLSEIIRKLKGYSSHTMRKKYSIKTRIWARKFHVQYIKDDRHMNTIISYINNNHIKHFDSWVMTYYGDLEIN